MIQRDRNAIAADSAAAPAPAVPSVPARANSDLGRPMQRDSLVDLLDRVLDKGLVIAGDISISLLDIELVTIKIRLLIASVDKAREMGIDWWHHDPQLSAGARRQQQKLDDDREKRELHQRIEELESRLAAITAQPPARSGAPPVPMAGRRLKRD
jgi:hypothetical protein